MHPDGTSKYSANSSNIIIFMPNFRRNTIYQLGNQDPDNWSQTVTELCFYGSYLLCDACTYVLVYGLHP